MRDITQAASSVGWRHEEERDGERWIGYPVELVHRAADHVVAALHTGARIDFHTADHPWRSFGDRWQDPTRLVWYPLDDRAHSVAAIREPTGRLLEWYVNIQLPVRLVGTSLVTRDLELDVVVAADLSSYRIKDQDKFDEACRRGTLGRDDARTALAELERVQELLTERRPWWSPALYEPAGAPS